MRRKETERVTELLTVSDDTSLSTSRPCRVRFEAYNMNVLNGM